VASLKKEIFLASRFKEFEEIRKQLAEKINHYNFMEAIDLNDNQASHRSPLEESLFHVRKAEIMILLVGETYGTIPEGETKSYTHLEYLEAIKESSNTRVLVFCIGKPYAGEHIEYSKTDVNMKQWQIELEKNHRLSKFGDETDVDNIVEKIMIMLLSSVYELNPEEDLALFQDDELYIEDLQSDDENFLYDDEVEFLDNKLSEQKEIGITDVDEELEGFDLLKIPGRLAALEQKKEAQKAIEIQDYYTARMHLKKALEFRPLDFETNYWLAKLYVASAKKNLFFEIEEYLLRAARIALQDNNPFKASHCYQLIIQASIFSDKENEGLKYIALAEEITPNFARLYYEKAKFMLYFGYRDESKDALKQAMNIRMEILRDIAHDPFFLQYKDVINEIKIEMKKHLHRSCYAILSQENGINQKLNVELKQIELDRLSIYQLWNRSRKSFIEQYRLLSHFISKVDDTDIPNIEKEISSYKLQCTQKRENILIAQKNSLQKLKEESRKKLDESLHTVKLRLLFSGMGSFICAIAIAMMIKYGKFESYISTLTGILILSVVIFFYMLNMKKKLKEKSKEAFLSKESEIKKATDERLFALESEEKEKIEQLQRKKEQLRIEYQNIHDAFEIFELNTVSKSTSKLVPFKSLNNASKGSVVRVTQYAYKKYVESGNTIEILEDFPESLKINEVDTENSSFLAKVIEKDRSSIILSRYSAYNDDRVTVDKPYNKIVKNEDNKVNISTMMAVRTYEFE